MYRDELYLAYRPRVGRDAEIVRAINGRGKPLINELREAVSQMLTSRLLSNQMVANRESLALRRALSAVCKGSVLDHASALAWYLLIEHDAREKTRAAGEGISEDEASALWRESVSDGLALAAAVTFDEVIGAARGARLNEVREAADAGLDFDLAAAIYGSR
jgi:hypothetical protein